MFDGVLHTPLNLDSERDTLVLILSTKDGVLLVSTNVLP